MKRCCGRKRRVIFSYGGERIGARCDSCGSLRALRKCDLCKREMDLSPRSMRRRFCKRLCRDRAWRARRRSAA